MVFTSCWNSLSCRSYVFRRLCKNLIAAYLCCGGMVGIVWDGGVCVGGQPVN